LLIVGDIVLVMGTNVFDGVKLRVIVTDILIVGDRTKVLEGDKDLLIVGDIVFVNKTNVFEGVKLRVKDKDLVLVRDIVLVTDIVPVGDRTKVFEGDILVVGDNT